MPGKDKKNQKNTIADNKEKTELTPEQRAALYVCMIWLIREHSGKDYSTDRTITAKVSEDMKLAAVFR